VVEDGQKVRPLLLRDFQRGGHGPVHPPTHYVDITGTEPRKRAACYAHASQAPDKFYALQEMVTRMRGVESGHKQAEGYIRHVQSPDFALPMAS